MSADGGSSLLLERNQSEPGCHFIVYTLIIEAKEKTYGNIASRYSRRHYRAICDSILREIASRVRDACTEKDILTRQRGDEFIIILPERTSLSLLHQEIKKIVQNVTRPLVMDKKNIHHVKQRDQPFSAGWTHLS